MEKKLKVYIVCLSFLNILCNCNDEPAQKNNNKEIFNVDIDSTILVDEQSDYICNYLKEELPGNEPVLFAPGIISTEADEYAFEISASGDEMMFIRNNKIMLIAKNKTGEWNKPFVDLFRVNILMMNPFSHLMVKKSILCQGDLQMIRNSYQIYGFQKKRTIAGRNLAR